jgi:hypothetical protein
MSTPGFTSAAVPVLPAVTGGGDPPAGGSSLCLQVLGPLRLWRDGVEVDAGPPQQALLLALFLTRVGRPASTSDLIDLIWGDDVPASALNVSSSTRPEPTWLSNGMRRRSLMTVAVVLQRRYTLDAIARRDRVEANAG